MRSRSRCIHWAEILIRANQNIHYEYSNKLFINISEKRNLKQKKMKITIFIFLAILFSLNQVKNLSIKNHDLTVNKKSVDKYYEVNNGIEKKNRR